MVNLAVETVSNNNNNKASFVLLVFRTNEKLHLHSFIFDAIFQMIVSCQMLTLQVKMRFKTIYQ